MKCLHCEKPLGLFARVSRQKFCCSDHEREHQRAQDRLAIELLDRVKAPPSSAKAKDAKKFPGTFGARAAAPPPPPAADSPEAGAPAAAAVPQGPRVIAPRVKGDVEIEATTLGAPAAPVAEDGPRDPFVYRGATRFNPTELLGALPPTELRNRETAVPRKIGSPIPASDDPFKLLDDRDIVIPASVRRAPIVLGPVEGPVEGPVDAPVDAPAPALAAELNPNGEIAPWTNVGVWIDGIVTAPPAFAFQVELRPRNFNTVALIAHPGGLLTEYIPFEVAAPEPVAPAAVEAPVVVEAPAPPPPKPDPSPAIYLPLTAAAHTGQAPAMRAETGNARAAFSWRTLNVAASVAAPVISTASARPSVAPAAAAVDSAFQSESPAERWTLGKPSFRTEVLAGAGAPSLSLAPTAPTKRVARATRPEVLSGNSYPRLRMRWLRPTGRRIPIAAPSFALSLAPLNRLTAAAVASPAAVAQTKAAANVSVETILPVYAASPAGPSLRPAVGVQTAVNAVASESRLRRSWPWLRSVTPVPAPAARFAPAAPALRCDPTVSVPVRLAYHEVEAAPVLAPVMVTFASPAAGQQPSANQQANQQKGQAAKARRR